MITNVARMCAAGVLAGAAAVLTACSGSSGPQPVVTVTVPPSAATSTPSAPTSGSGAPSASGSSSGSAAVPAHQTKLPGDCDDVLPDYPVAQAVGRTAGFTGSDGFVVGVPDKSIGRVATINCRYGVIGSGASAKAKLEIGVSLYKTAAQASARITATVADYTAHGATATPTTVSGQPAQLATGGAGADYSEPLLVVAVGQRTIAISVSTAIATGADVATDAVKVAELAVQKTAA